MTGGVPTNIVLEFADLSAREYAAEQMSIWRAWSRRRQARRKRIAAPVVARKKVLVPCVVCGIMLERCEATARRGGAKCKECRYKNHKEYMLKAGATRRGKNGR